MVYAKSESGDDYGLIKTFYTHPPTTEALKVLTHADNFGQDGWSEDWSGPGFYGSYLHLEIAHVVSGIERSRTTVWSNPPTPNESDSEPPKAKLEIPAALEKRLMDLDGLLGKVDSILVDLTENPELEDLEPELQDTFEAFADSVDWVKYTNFLKSLRKHTNYKG